MIKPVTAGRNTTAYMRTRSRLCKELDFKEIVVLIT
jgi:hypothetical protein